MVEELDLLTAVKIPFEDSKTQYVDAEGSDGFPAIGFRTGSDVKMLWKAILPEKLFPEFSILIRAKPRSHNGGYIFAVVNSYENVVQLGVKLSRTSASSMTTISLIYTEPGELATNIIANFTVNSFVNDWTRIALKVNEENVTLFLNCQESATVEVRRQQVELEFEPASTLYIAKAGSKIQDYYEVSARMGRYLASLTLEI
ncbi:hypothetical protein Trydic_g15136 [Trypoxylus dichotomus]